MWVRIYAFTGKVQVSVSYFLTESDREKKAKNLAKKLERLNIPTRQEEFTTAEETKAKLQKALDEGSAELLSVKNQVTQLLHKIEKKREEFSGSEAELEGVMEKTVATQNLRSNTHV